MKTNHFYIFVILLLLVGCSSPNQRSDSSINPKITPTHSPSLTYTQTQITAKYTFTPVPTKQPPAITPTVIPTEIPIPTSDISGLVDVWKIYSNAEYGFSFEYPKIYDLSVNNCGIEQINSSRFDFYIMFGFRGELGIKSNDTSSLSQFVDQWIGESEVGSRNDLLINGNEAITIEYRFGGLNRYGTTTFIGRDGEVYVFNFTAGGFCDLKEIGIDEYTAYKHAIDTFKVFIPYP